MSPSYLVLSIDPVNDWFLAEATGLIHTYPAPNNGGVPWIMSISSCCRIYANRNAPGTNFRFQTSVDLSVFNASPRSTTPPIVFMAINTLNNLLIPVAEPDGDDFSCRLATFAESGISTHPGTGVSGPINDLTVTAVPGGCQVTWETTGTAIGELWALQMAIEDSRGGTPLGRTALEFLIEIASSVGDPPVCDSPPTPTGTLPLADNTLFTATIQGSDPDAGDTLVLNSSGIPAGATVTPTLPTVGGSPISTVLSWTPTLFDLGPQPFLFTVTDNTNQQALCSFILDVQFDPFGGNSQTPQRGVRPRVRRPPGSDTDGARCVETSDPDCPPPLGPTPQCDPDFTGVPFTPFPAGSDELEIDLDLSPGDGDKTVCCELIDGQGMTDGPFCQTIELVTCADADGDGFGDPGDPDCPAGPARDCDDNNNLVNPDALELCNDGIDNNCDGDTDDEDSQCTVLFVELTSFTARAEPGGVRVAWSTSVEIDNLGFRLLRGRAGEEPVVVSDGLIPGAGDTVTGANYEYVDSGRQRPGRVQYYLEDIDTSGFVTRHGPVEVRLRRPVGPRGGHRDLAAPAPDRRRRR